jgi:hypothetical protein
VLLSVVQARAMFCIRGRPSTAIGCVACAGSPARAGRQADARGGWVQVAVCGKGVTFDTGGYNIKAGPGSMLEVMKFDMGGSAATLGAANIVGALEPAGVEVRPALWPRRCECALTCGLLQRVRLRPLVLPHAWRAPPRAEGFGSCSTACLLCIGSGGVRAAGPGRTCVSMHSCAWEDTECAACSPLGA